MVPGSGAPAVSVVPSAVPAIPDIAMPDINMIGGAFAEDPEEVARKLEEERLERLKQYTDDLERRMSAGLLGIEIELAFLIFMFCCFVFKIENFNMELAN